MNKVIRRADLDAIQAESEITLQQANPRLVSLPTPPSNDVSAKETQTYENAHFRYPAHQAQIPLLA
jgi:hypothetical protein